MSHFPCGSVDWNYASLQVCRLLHRHFPCGSVDWNSITFTLMRTYLVTSLAEVWIETLQSRPSLLPFRSLPLRKCGLKPQFFLCRFGRCRVTSLAEVWIETCAPWINETTTASLPLRKCGLKLAIYRIFRGDFSHFPCGSVDWNILIHLELKCKVVTSLAEVWIETPSGAVEL